MGKITELQKLIENTVFDLDIVDMYNCQDLLLKNFLLQSVKVDYT